MKQEKHFIVIANFNSQDFPITKNKINFFLRSVDSVYEFLKCNYIYKNIELKTKTSQLWKDYEDWCKAKSRKGHTKSEFKEN